MKGTAVQPPPRHPTRIGKRSAQRHRREGISDGSRRVEMPSAARCAARTARPGCAGDAQLVVLTSRALETSLTTSTPWHDEENSKPPTPSSHIGQTRFPQRCLGFSGQRFARQAQRASPRGPKEAEVKAGWPRFGRGAQPATTTTRRNTR